MKSSPSPATLGDATHADLARAVLEHGSWSPSIVRMLAEEVIRLSAVSASARSDVPAGDVVWLHRFLNASTFGPPPSEIQRAHAIVDALTSIPSETLNNAAAGATPSGLPEQATGTCPGVPANAPSVPSARVCISMKDARLIQSVLESVHSELRSGNVTIWADNVRDSRKVLDEAIHG